MEYLSPTLFAEALEKMQLREIMPTSLGTLDLAKLPLEIRERSFFSAKVESARLLQAMRDYCVDFIAGEQMEGGGYKAHSRAQFVADMREIAIREGLGVIDEATGEILPYIRESDLRDIRSIARLELIFDTQVEAAQEYGYYAQGQDEDILAVYPAQRFIRVRPVLAPRAYHEAALDAVRRKDDVRFWVGLNRDFGVPWGPWGFNSGCGVEDVDLDEAVALGVMKAGDVVKPLAGRKFNEGVEAGVREMDDDILAALRRESGGTVARGSLKMKETKE